MKKREKEKKRGFVESVVGAIFLVCLAVKKIKEENIAFGVLSLLFDNFNFSSLL